MNIAGCCGCEGQWCQVFQSPLTPSRYNLTNAITARSTYISSTTDHDRVVIYHDATKHHPHRYARSQGFLDWATQPDPFRRFPEAPLVPLLTGPRDNEPAYDALFVPGGIVPQSVTRRSISTFFECSLGLSAWKAYGESTWALRCNPSSGNLHPTEGYLVCGSITGISEQPAIFHYAPKEHVLERRHTIDSGAWNSLVSPWKNGAFFIGLSSIYWREAWKYGERAFRYCQHDVGHALSGLRLAAAMLGWRLTVLEDLGDDEIAHLLGLDRKDDFGDAEREAPELLAVVTPSDGQRHSGIARTDVAALAEAAVGLWEGKANQLSSDHVQWDMIDMVADATKKPRTPIMACPPSLSPLQPQGPCKDSTPIAREIFLQRRSATDFDGRTSIRRDQFYAMLSRVMPTGAAPFDAIDWPPAIHLLMFVHLIDDLSPGLYALARDPSKVGALRSATNPDFVWTLAADAPAGLPLYMLKPADCRRAAAQLSLGQAIAGDGAFSFGMVADFEAMIRAHGSWCYRRLFWEAGMIGQVLYLEAEAAAVRLGNKLRATGIGAYFDDSVHGVFGLSGHQFQSMYHFTMGGAVDDTRLTTRPPYDETITLRR